MNAWKKFLEDWYFKTHAWETEGLYERFGVRAYWKYGINGGRRTSVKEARKAGCALALRRISDLYFPLSLDDTKRAEVRHLWSLLIAILFSGASSLAGFSSLGLPLLLLALIFDLCPILEQRWIRLRYERIKMRLKARESRKSSLSGA